MDEIRIWNRARSEAQIRKDKDRELTGGEAGLVLYYNFDTISGYIAKDLSINRLDGQIVRAEYSEQTPLGRFKWIYGVLPFLNPTGR
ncbi:MAG: hypothetical protein DRH50_16125, partial [Deltaproteobacteria bacterium]